MTAEDMREIHRELWQSRGEGLEPGLFRTEEMQGHIAPEGIAAELDGALDDFRADAAMEPGPDGLADALAALACAISEIRPFRYGNLPTAWAAMVRLAADFGITICFDGFDSTEWTRAQHAWLDDRDDRPMREILHRAVPGASEVPCQKRRGLFARFLAAMRLPS